MRPILVRTRYPAILSLVLMSRLLRPAYAIALVLAMVAYLVPAAASDTRGTTRPSQLVVGKRLYRKYCGECHALSAALAAGFGSSSGGFGRDGGPSFNDLRIPYNYSVDAVSEPTGGHEIVSLRMSMAQLSAVAKFIAVTTRQNPIPALPTDG